MNRASEQMLELTTGAVAAGGGCVAHAPDGRVVFVRHSLPGERVRAVVREETRSYLRADAVEILEAAAGRVVPPCPHAGPGKCGGCDWQHVSVPVQRLLKADLVAEQLRRVAGVVRGIRVEALPPAPGRGEGARRGGGAGDDDGLGWRTRVRFAVDSTGRVGFRRHRSHDIEVVERCLIASEGVEAMGIEDRIWPDIDEVDVFAASGPGANGAATPALVRVSARRAGGGSTPGRSLPGRSSPGRSSSSRSDRSRLHLRVLDRQFSVSPGVFWQVHPSAAEVLARAVLKGLAPRPGERVADLYAGAGLFTALLGREVGETGSVLAVERDRRAASDCRRNVADLERVSVQCSAVTASLVERGLGRPDLVVLDPARDGAGRPVSAALAGLDPAPRRIAYVACDPASFARDLRVFLDARWSIASLRAFDLFPMTEHVELVACLDPPLPRQDGADALGG